MLSQLPTELQLHIFEDVAANLRDLLSLSAVNKSFRKFFETFQAHLLSTALEAFEPSLGVRSGLLLFVTLPVDANLEFLDYTGNIPDFKILL